MGTRITRTHVIRALSRTASVCNALNDRSPIVARSNNGTQIKSLGRGGRAALVAIHREIVSIPELDSKALRTLSRRGLISVRITPEIMDDMFYAFLAATLTGHRPSFHLSPWAWSGAVTEMGHKKIEGLRSRLCSSEIPCSPRIAAGPL